MILADATFAAGPVGYLIALAGSGGILGATIGLIKLRGDRDSQAVSQAQGAVETMAEVQDQLEKTLARANESRDFYRNRCDELTKELGDIHGKWGPFPVDDEA